ncbi:hypothetical protein GGR50DRAFT_665970 [Xylaria sp. CBS 124048]|nr:hypothetical protein GGR50DRAFT_665970 [Xylaria sp. CBS 124048]
MVLAWRLGNFISHFPITMPSIFSRIRGKDGKFRSKKNGNDESSLQLQTKPRWEDAYARTSVDPDEVQDLVHRCTVELKSRALDIPFLLLPFRPTSDPSAVRTFIRHFFDHENHSMHGEALSQELRMTEPMVIAGVLKWCWSRIAGGLVGWDAYELFKVGEKDSNMAPDAFSTFIPISIDNVPRSNIIFDYFDLLSAIAAHGKANGLSGRKLSRMASWWVFEHKDTSDGFEGGYKVWLRAADATSHLFFAYLRSLSPQQPKAASISLLPMSLQKLLQETEYPPQAPTLTFTSTYRVVMIVDAVSPTPFSLLRRANHFQYREADRALQDFSEYEDPVQALTEECRRVLKAISLANQSQVSSSKHSTGLRDASWSRFEDIGFSGSLEEEEEDEETVKISHSQRPGLRTTPASDGQLGRPTTPSWADFLSAGFVDDSAPSNTLLPPDKVLPPIETHVRSRTAQSHHGRLESDRVLEPGELASITQFTFDEAFWWVWMSSLAPEETAARKSAFGRCAVLETAIQSGKWLVMEEMVKGAAPELDATAYIAEKKGFFSWTRRGKGGLTRTKSTGMGIFNRGDQVNSTSNAANQLSKASMGPDQQAKIQAAAQQLSARQQRLQQADIPERRGRTDADIAGDKTNSVLTLQPVIMKEASPAMKWASKYDKEAIREAYLGNITAGRGGLGQQLSGMAEADGNLNGSEVADKPLPIVQEPATEHAPPVPQKSMLDVHPAERSNTTGRESPLPPLPLGEEVAETARQTAVSPMPPSPTGPDGKKKKKLHKEDKKTTGGLRKLFGRNKNRNSKGYEPAEVTNLAVAPVRSSHSSRAPSPLPEPARPQPVIDTSVQEASTAQADDDKTPTQPSAPVAAGDATDGVAAEPELSRINTADANEANNEFSRFDQGPLLDQPAFVPVDDESATVSPSMVRNSNHVEEPESDAAPAPVVPTQDRWAAIRKSAAERAARQGEEQPVDGHSQAVNGTDEPSTEETIESRVARIKARVAELTGNIEGSNSPGASTPRR